MTWRNPHTWAVIAATACLSVPAAAGVSRTITVGPDSGGWYNAASTTSTVADSILGPSVNSLRASGDGKNQFYLTGAEIFGDTPSTLGDIESIGYTTKKSDGASGVDWFIQIYTDPYSGSPGSSWYGNRVQAEPYLGSNLDAPADQWNTWSTDAGTNQLNWGDSSSGDFGAGLGSFDDFKSAGVMGGSGTYGDAGILYFTFGTGSAWANGFEGLLGPITIVFTDGTSTVISFGASTPVVPSPLGAAALAGLGLAARRRRR